MTTRDDTELLRQQTRWPAETWERRRRYANTLDFIASSEKPPKRILDLGEPNPLGAILRGRGYEVVNTESGVDLDLHPEVASRDDVDAVTAFEILEHLVAPFGVLRAMNAPRLFATVPLQMWFVPAYRNPDDPWDRHFHEFEDWQFDWLVEKAGWKIIRRERWTGPVRRLGIRPLLRLMTPRYYAVEAIRP